MLEQAIARDPKYLFPYSHLAVHLLAEGRHRDAAAVARQAVAVDRDWPTGHLILGGALFRLGDLEGAKRHARTAADIVQQKLPEPYLLLAKVLRTQGDCAGAREYLKRYLSQRTSALAVQEMRESVRVIESCLAVTGP
jgi:Flp pilus assembly protein TadD